MSSNLPPGITNSMIEDQVPSIEDDNKFENLCNELEAIVDKHCLYEVVQALSYIAWTKSDHVLTTWQDTLSSELWKSAAFKLDGLNIQV